MLLNVGGYEQDAHSFSTDTGPCLCPSAVNDTLLPSGAYCKTQMSDNSQQNDVLSQFWSRLRPSLDFGIGVQVVECS